MAAWQALALTFTGYLLLALLALAIAIPPGRASPLYPAAGFAVAAALTWGRVSLWAVPPAAMLGNLLSLDSLATFNTGVALVWLATGVGAALQAALGAWCLRRFVAQPVLLSEPRDLARFMLLIAPAACLVSASIAVAVLVGSGTIPADAAAFTWGTWWLGDVLGMVIGVPLTLAAVGRPREDWAPRRVSVALPLVAVALLVGLGVRETLRADADLARKTFEREAESATNTLLLTLQEPQRALEALRGVADAAPALDRETFARSVAPWLIGGEGVVALGYSERVARAELPAFEARERSSGAPEYRVIDRRDAGVPAPDEDFVVAVRFIEPLGPNARALGVNSRSVARARVAIDRTGSTGRPAATQAFDLTQGGRGVVIYQALYRGTPATADERTRNLRAVVFATLRLDDLLVAASRQTAQRLRMCLLDNDAPPAQRVLAGDSACLALSHHQPLHVQPVAFGGRQWDLRVFDAAPPPPGFGRGWPFALVGLAATALLGAMLLTITGRARRIAAAVDERTAELSERSAQLQAEAVQRQRTAIALRDSQQRLRNILDHAPIGVAYTDHEGRIREANPKLREMLGLPIERLSGAPIARLLHPEDREAEAQARAGLLAGEVPMAHWHLRCVAADGRVLWTRASVSVLRGNKGDARRMVWVIEDITEHLELEQAQRARKGAEAANRAKSEFLSRMSHELRTPLNAMLGFTQLLELDRRQPLAPHHREWTSQMRTAGWHLLHMINDTLDLSRIEAGNVELQPASLNLEVLLGEASALVAAAAAKRRVQMAVHLGEGARAALGDATRVKQIVTNLLSNAIKYNEPEGRVVVTSRLVGADRVALDVIDTGAGMTPEQVAQLFQPFNRLGREDGPVEGTGIGLVISQRLAELMGGSLAAKSSPGMGSTFTLELPRAAEVPTAARADIDLDELAPTPAYRRRLVHYIEDNETNAEVMRGIFALRPQIDLEISPLAKPGLASIRQRHPNLVLLDMQLPDMDGLDVLRALQADPATADIPVIVVSADATEARVNEAIAAGATQYITKPVNFSELLSALDDVLEEMDTHFG